ncbi:kelch repeat and BTB domain-containing protein 13-like [Branchiostoma floridae x Branchiostoma japonicum]
MEEETVSLIVEDEEILVDKQTLMNHSQYFRAMFSSGMREATQDSVVLHDVTANVIRELLDFFRTGQLTLDQSTTQEILTTAIFLQMDDVINHAKVSLTVENASEMFAVAELHFLRDLEKATFQYLSKNYLELLQSETYDRLTEEQQEYVLSLRFGGKDTICTIGSYNRDVHLTEDAPRTMHLLDDKNGDWTPYCDVPSSFSTNACGVAVLNNYLFLTGGFTSFKSDQMQKSSLCFDVVTNKWTPFPPMTELRANFAFIGLGNTLYAIGGNKLYGSSGTETKAINSVEAYDLRKGSWKKLEPLPTDMIRPCVAT